MQKSTLTDRSKRRGSSKPIEASLPSLKVGDLDWAQAEMDSDAKLGEGLEQLRMLRAKAAKTSSN